jgi:uncharacterized protein
MKQEIIAAHNKTSTQLNQSHSRESFVSNLKYLAVGVFFGIVFIKAEITSWFRIQEMFRFQSFHMYGVIGTAVATGMLSLFILKKLGIKTITGEEILTRKRVFDWGHVWGSLLFGFGWAITGACPGPLYAQISSGFGVVGITLISAIAGTWVYGAVQKHLPH